MCNESIRRLLLSCVMLGETIWLGTRFTLTEHALSRVQKSLQAWLLHRRFCGVINLG